MLRKQVLEWYLERKATQSSNNVELGLKLMANVDFGGQQGELAEQSADDWPLHHTLATGGDNDFLAVLPILGSFDQIWNNTRLIRAILWRFLRSLQSRCSYLKRLGLSNLSIFFFSLTASDFLPCRLCSVFYLTRLWDTCLNTMDINGILSVVFTAMENLHLERMQQQALFLKSLW